MSRKVETVPSGMCTQLSHSLIRVFTGCCLHSQGYNVSQCGQRRLRSYCADALVDLSLRWVLMSEGMFSYVAAQKVNRPHALHISTSIAYLPLSC